MKPENDLDYMELFNKTFLLSPIGMAMMSKEGSWLKVNPAFCHMLGLKETELVETTFQQLVINEHLNSSKPYIKNEIAPQDYSYLEKPIYHKNGLKIWLSFNFTQLDQSNDYLVYIQDITTKKRFEADMIINESSSQIGSWRKNRQTNEITWSTEMYRIFGLDIATEITPGLLLSKVYPGDQEKLLKDIHALYTTHPLRTIFRIIRGDGEVRIIDTHMELLPNEEGEPSIVAGTLQDITERRQQDATLHYHDYLFKLFSEHSEDVIYCLSPDSIVVYVSPTIKKVLGYEPQELIGSHAKSLWHQEDKAVAVQQTMIHSDIYTYDYRVQHKQGHYIWLHTIEKVVRDQEGNIILNN